LVFGEILVFFSPDRWFLLVLAFFCSISRRIDGFCPFWRVFARFLAGFR